MQDKHVCLLTITHLLYAVAEHIRDIKTDDGAGDEIKNVNVKSEFAFGNFSGYAAELTDK